MFWLIRNIIILSCVWQACFGYNLLTDQRFNELSYNCDFKFEIAHGANVTVVWEDARSTSIVFELILDPRCSFKEGVQLMIRTTEHTATKNVDFKCTRTQ